MLDQNTDRMWYTIGAVLIGAAIIFGANSLFPSAFASISYNFESTIAQFSDNDNLIKNYEVVGGWLNHEGFVTDEVHTSKSRDWTSGFIPTEDADYITFSTNGRHQTKRAMFYDENKEPMLPRNINTEPLDTVMVYVIPDGAKYIRVSGMNWATNVFKVEYGRFSTGPVPESPEPYFGRNLLLNSKNFTNGYYVEGEGLTVSVTNEGYLKVVAEEGNTGRIHLPEFDNSMDHLHSFAQDIIDVDNKVSLSIQVMSTDTVTDHQRDNPRISFNHMNDNGYFGIVHSDWSTIYKTYGYSEELDLKTSIFFSDLTGTYYFRNPKIDIGSASTPYSMAPEDNE